MSRFGDRIWLGDVHTLVFHRGAMTKSRRTKPYPQLVCNPEGNVGCPDKKEYLFSSAICTNLGLGENGDPNWGCTASSLPDGVELGEILVTCEGYTSKYDPFVLKGSCNLEYTLEGVRPEGSAWGGFVMFILIVLCCWCCCCRRKSDEDSRGPPPSYDYMLLGSEPVTAVAVESHDKSLPGGDGTSGLYGDPEDASGSTPSKGASSASTAEGEHSVSKAPPGLADLEGSKRAGGLGTGTAVAVGAAAATAAVAATTVAATRARQSDASLPLPQGWEARVDPRTGETFYVDHTSRTTTWTHPSHQRGPAHEYNSLLPNQGGGPGRQPGWGSGWGRAWTRHATPSADRRSPHDGYGLVAPQTTYQGGAEPIYQSPEEHEVASKHRGGFGHGLGAFWRNITGMNGGDHGHPSTAYGTTQRWDTGGEGGHTSTGFGSTQRREGGGGGFGGTGHR